MTTQYHNDNNNNNNNKNNGDRGDEAWWNEDIKLDWHTDRLTAAKSSPQ